MGVLRFTYLELARLAHFQVIPIAEKKGVQVLGSLLILGAGHNRHEVASISCRRLLRHQGVRSERQVRELVEQHGYRYVAPTGRARAA